MMFALISVCVSVSGFQKKTVIKKKKKKHKRCGVCGGQKEIEREGKGVPCLKHNQLSMSALGNYIDQLN